MIPYQVDPSLYAAPPQPLALGDGFAPPAPQGLCMATHPVEPEAPEPGGDAPPDQPNTSRLPVEPEFLPDWSPTEPEDPNPKPHLP